MHQENFSMNKEFKYQSDPRENANVSEDPIRNNADNNAHTCNNSSNSSIHDYICFEICIPPNILTGEPGFIGDLICFRICIYPTIFNGYSYFCSSIYDKSRSSEKENFFLKISTNGIDLIIYSSYLEKENNDLEREKNNLAVTKDYSHLWVQCEICYALNYRRFLKSRMHVCEQCGYHLKMTSAERIELSIDPGTWDAMDDGMVSLDPIGFDSDEMKYSGSISQTNPSSIYFLSSKKYIYSQEGGYERNTNKKSLSQNWKDNCEKQGERSKMDSNHFSNPLDDIDFDSSNIDSNQYLDSSKDIHLAQKVDEKEEDKAPSNIDLHSEQDDRPFNMDFCSPEKQKRNRALAELEAKEALEKVEAKEAFAELERDFHVNFFDDILSTYSKEGKEPDNDQPYKDRIISYQKDTGLTEAVQTGTGQLNGIPVAIGVMDFQFIGGSMGSVVGEKIT